MPPESRTASTNWPESSRLRQVSLEASTDDGTRQTTLRRTGVGEESPGATRTDVNAFRIGPAVLVRHYFEEDAAFAILAPYYDERHHRFEIPRDEYRTVSTALSTHGYRLNPVDDVGDYAVVVRKYTDHPESVFENAVAEVSADEYNVFVLNEASAVSAAVESGAQRLDDAPVSVNFPTGYGVGPVTVQDLA